MSEREVMGPIGVLIVLNISGTCGLIWVSVVRNCNGINESLASEITSQFQLIAS